MTITPIKEIAGAPLNEEQTTYLTGFFAGMQQRAVVFADFLSDYKEASANAAKEEKTKRRFRSSPKSGSRTKSIPSILTTGFLKTHERTRRRTRKKPSDSNGTDYFI